MRPILRLKEDINDVEFVNKTRLNLYFSVKSF